MIRWEAGCYRCRGAESGQEANETLADQRIADFRREHQASCGASMSMWHSKTALPLTGDGTPIPAGGTP